MEESTKPNDDQVEKLVGISRQTCEEVQVALKRRNGPSVRMKAMNKLECASYVPFFRNLAEGALLVCCRCTRLI